MALGKQMYNNKQYFISNKPDFNKIYLYESDIYKEKNQL